MSLADGEISKDTHGKQERGQQHEDIPKKHYQVFTAAEVSFMHVL